MSFGGKQPKKSIYSTTVPRVRLWRNAPDTPDLRGPIPRVASSKIDSSSSSSSTSGSSSDTEADESNNELDIPNAQRVDSDNYDSGLASPLSDHDYPKHELEHSEHQPDDPAFAKFEEGRDDIPNYEPENDKLPEIKQPATFEEEVDIIKKQEEQKKRDRDEYVSDYEEEDESDDPEAMDEYESYYFIKDHPEFFGNEIRAMIVSHYERSVRNYTGPFDYTQIPRKIRYIKYYHPQWYEAAYESAVRDLALAKYNRPLQGF